MAVSLKHTTVAVGTDAGNGEIRKAQWNENHTLTLDANKLLGRATAGTGAVEEIDCTAAGRALLDDADAAAQRTTLGAAGSGAIGSSGLTMATARLLGRTTGATGAVEEISVGASLTLTSGSLSVTGLSIASGKTLTANNTFTLAGTDSTTMTFPSTSATIARTDAGQTFSGNQTFSGQPVLTLQTLTDGANIAWNCANGAKARVTLGGNRTMSAVTNAVEGTSYTLWVVQDGTGGRTLAYTTSGAGSYDFGTEGTPVLSTTASAADCLGFEAVSIGGTLKLRFMGIKRGFT